MPAWRPLLALALLCLGSAHPAPAAPASVTIEETYRWPRGAGVEARLRRDGLLVIANTDLQGVAAGLSSPWALAGPLVSRGLLRLASDPLGFSPESPVFEEGTALALDSSLESRRRGAALTPLPGVGLFAREGPEGHGAGIFTAVSPAGGLLLDGLLLSSWPAASAAGDEWYFDRSPSPGGQVTHGCARVSLGAGGLGWTVAAGASSAEWAGPGAFADVRLRGSAAGVETDVLLAAASPGYRSPDGKGTTEQSLAGVHLRVGGDGDRDRIDASWSLAVGRPSASPGLELPWRLRVRLALARQSSIAYDLPVWWIAEADKDVHRSADATQEEISRVSSAVSLAAGGVEARLSLGVSGTDGARIAGELALRPSSELRLGLETQAQRLGGPAANASLEGALVLSGPSDRHELRVGLVECPLWAGLAGAAKSFRLSLASSFRVW